MPQNNFSKIATKKFNNPKTVRKTLVLIHKKRLKVTTQGEWLKMQTLQQQ